MNGREKEKKGKRERTGEGEASGGREIFNKNNEMETRCKDE
jgi:hypothetical protein